MFRVTPHRHASIASTPIRDMALRLPVAESAVEDEDVHLQQAHDALRSRIAKARREKKDVGHLEKRLASIAGLLNKQKGKED